MVTEIRKMNLFCGPIFGQLINVFPNAVSKMLFFSNPLQDLITKSINFLVTVLVLFLYPRNGSISWTGTEVTLSCLKVKIENVNNLVSLMITH